MSDNQVDFANFLFIIGLAIAALIMIIYLLFFDDDNHETEIDNIYRQIADNSKLGKQLQKELDEAIKSPFGEKQLIHEEYFDDNL